MTTLGDEGGSNQRRDIGEPASFSARGQGKGLRLYSELMESQSLENSEQRTGMF